MPELSPDLLLGSDLLLGAVDVVIPPAEVVTPTGSVLLCDKNGSEVAELEVDHTLRFEKSRAGSCIFHLGFDQTGASELIEMLGDQVPLLHVYRRKDLIFCGHWSPQSETADASDQEGIACEFRSPLARLETRYLSAPVEYSPVKGGKVDQSQIVWDLIDRANGQASTGLIKGVFESSTPRKRRYEAGQSIAEAITDLCDLESGPAVTETFLPGAGGDRIALLNVWASGLGRELTKTGVFEYGETTIDNVASVERTIGYPVNRVIAIGGTATTSGGLPTVSIADDAASQAKFGMYAVTADFSQTIKNQDDYTELNAAAHSLIQPYPAQQITFEPDPLASPSPIDDYWLNDMITFHANQDAFQSTMEARINAIEIDRDGYGTELAHRIELGYQAVQPLEVIRRGWRVTFRHPKRVSIGPHGRAHLQRGRTGPHGKSRLTRPPSGHLRWPKGTKVSHGPGPNRFRRHPPPRPSVGPGPG